MKFVAGLLGVVLVVGGVVGMSCIEKVKPGYVGVVYAPSQGVQKDVLSQGWHFVSPLDKVTSFSVATEQFMMSADKSEGSTANESIDVMCKDGQINIDFEMAYQFDREKVADLFATYRGMKGEDIVNTIIRPKLRTYITEVTSQYTVLEAHMEKKAQLNADVLTHISDKLEDFGIIVTSANIPQTRVSSEIEAAITRRTKAAQELEAAKQENERAKIEAERNRTVAQGEAEVRRVEAEAQAERITIKAQADADAIKIAADAQAEANKKLQQSLNKEILAQQYIEAWKSGGAQVPKIAGEGSNLVVTPDVLK